MEKQMREDPELPTPYADIETKLDLKKYRPGMLSEWDFEIKQLNPREMLSMPKIDFGVNVDEASKLKSDIEKFEKVEIQHTSEKIV